MCLYVLALCGSFFIGMECPWHDLPRQCLVSSFLFSILHAKLNCWGRTLSATLSMFLRWGFDSVDQQLEWFMKNADNIGEQLKSQSSMGPYETRLVHNNGNQCTYYSNLRIHAMYIVHVLNNRVGKVSDLEPEDWQLMVISVLLWHCFWYRYFVYMYHRRDRITHECDDIRVMELKGRQMLKHFTTFCNSIMFGYLYRMYGQGVY